MKNLTTNFNFTLGTCPGYFHNNDGANIDVVSKKYIEIAERIYSTTGIFISAVVSTSKCLYHTEWGCPQNGEDTYTFQGIRNPSFCKDDSKWREAVLLIVTELKKEFKQSTVTIEFSEKDIEYLS